MHLHPEYKNRLPIHAWATTTLLALPNHEVGTSICPVLSETDPSFEVPVLHAQCRGWRLVAFLSMGSEFIETTFILVLTRVFG